MKRTNIYLSELQEIRLKELSKKLDLSLAELVRRAVDNFLDELDQKKQIAT